jgi:hypothetical protein
MILIINFMKRIISFFILILFPFLLNAQGLDSILIERYYVSDSEDAAYSAEDETNPIPAGAVTWRFFVDMQPGYNLQTIYGNAPHPLTLSTTTSFFNNIDYGTERPGYSANNAKKGTTMIDSWLTLGSGCANSSYWGVLKSEDTDAPFVNSKNILKNDDPTAGIPLTSQDGLLLSSNVPTASFIGNVPYSVFGDGTPNDNQFGITDGAWYFLGGAVGPTENNRVLIAQITTDGDLSYQLNIQLGKDLGGGNSLSELYVYSDPSGDEISGSQYKLSGVLKAVIRPPVISIVSPLNNSNHNTGDTLTISANASDPDGSVTLVEFFREGIKIGEDADGTDGFNMEWIALAGQAEITAKASDNDYNTSISEPVSIRVTDPGVYFPIVSMALPSPGAILLYNVPCLVAASSGDMDGTITQVEFFANGVSIGIDNTGPLSYFITWTPLEPGQVDLTAISTDNDFNTTVSAPVTVKVQDPVITRFREKDLPLVYPNPSDGNFYIYSPSDVSLEITDLQGRLVFVGDEIPAGNRQEIKLCTLNEGIYVLKLYNSGTVYFMKILIRK